LDFTLSAREVVAVDMDVEFSGLFDTIVVPFSGTQSSARSA